MEREDLKEVGKQILNIGVAIVVFAIIQPFIKHEFDLITTLFAIIFYVASTILGAYLIRKGGKKNE